MKLGDYKSKSISEKAEEGAFNLIEKLLAKNKLGARLDAAVAKLECSVKRWPMIYHGLEYLEFFVFVAGIIGPAYLYCYVKIKWNIFKAKLIK